MIMSATENVNRAEIEMVIDGVEKSSAWKNHYNNIQKYIPIEVGRYVLDYNTKDALENISNQYPKFTFQRTLINS